MCQSEMSPEMLLEVVGPPVWAANFPVPLAPAKMPVPAPTVHVPDATSTGAGVSPVFPGAQSWPFSCRVIDPSLPVSVSTTDVAAHGRPLVKSSVMTLRSLTCPSSVAVPVPITTSVQMPAEQLTLE